MKKVMATISLLIGLFTWTNLYAQEAVTVECPTPGEIESYLGEAENASSVVIKGSIDKRDFDVINYTLYQVQEIDFSDATLVAYDEFGTIYADNEFPTGLGGMSSVEKVVLPRSITKISDQALVGLPALQSIVIPGERVPEATMLIEQNRLSAVTLHVHGSLLDQYRNASDKKAWGFTNIVAIEGTAASEPKPNATFALKNALNKELNIKLIASSGKVLADWGDGVLHELIVSDEVPNNLAEIKSFFFKPTVENPTIKLYAEGLQAIGFARFYLSASSPIMESVDLSNAPDLEVLLIDNVKLQTLDLKANGKLKVLHAFGNLELSSLDIAHLTDLEELLIQYTGIGQIDLSNTPRLRLLNMERTKIKELDLSSCQQVQTLFASNSELESVDITGCAALYDFRIGEAPLKSLKMGGNTAMNNFQVFSCPLQEIDFKAMPNVEKLFFDNTLLEKADLRELHKLVNLGANECRLKTLKVSSQAQLKKFFIYGNQLDACALDSLYHGLAQTQAPAYIVVSVDKVSNPGFATSKTIIAKRKGYILFDDASRTEQEGDGSGCNNDLATERIVRDNSDKKFVVHPTQVEEKVHLSGEGDIVRVSLIDLTGRTLLQCHPAANGTVMLKGIGGGNYILLIETSDGTAETHWIEKK